MAEEITISVKHGKVTYDVTISVESTVQQLREDLHRSTLVPAKPHPRPFRRSEVPPALQKIVFKAALKPEDDGKTLRAVGLSGGSKLMLVGTPAKGSFHCSAKTR
jgi:hypothetical protein